VSSFLIAFIFFGEKSHLGFKAFLNEIEPAEINIVFRRIFSILEADSSLSVGC